MKKVLEIFDGSHYSEGSAQFITRLNEIEPCLLVGVFLPSVDYSDAMLYYLGGMGGPIYIPDITYDPSYTEKNIEKFKDFCEKNTIEYRVHSDEPGLISDVLNKESRYADLMILGNELFYENLGNDTQQEYLQDTMHKAECPVVLVPEQLNFPESIIIAYDGSASSVFAIKQFAYLFPELAELPTLIVYASTKENSLPDLSYIEELGTRHFKNLTFFKLEIDPSKYFNTWTADKGNAMLVTGAHGRTSVSELFKHSFVKDIINDHKLPLFIAHL